MPASKHQVDKLIAILNRLVEHPHAEMRQTARDFKLSPVSLYNWSSISARDEAADLKEKSEFYFEWMAQTSYWHRHVVLARRLSILQIDSRLRDAAVNNHREPLFRQGGEPVWEVDPQLASDAQDPELWAIMHAPRPITDIFKRDVDGALIQAYMERPPNPAILIKAASSLLPEIYGEKIEHNVTVGGVVHIGPNNVAAIAPGKSDFTMLAETPELVKPPTNILAVAEKCSSIEEFDATYGGKRLIEGQLFYETDGSLQAPLSHIVIVFGSELHRKYSEAGIAVKTVSAEPLIAQGYENNFLKRLAPKAERPDLAELRRLAAIPVGPNKHPEWPVSKGPISTSKVTGKKSWDERLDHTGAGPNPATLYGGGAKVII